MNAKRSKRGKQRKLVTVSTDAQKNLRRSQVTSEQFHAIARERQRQTEREREGERERQRKKERQRERARRAYCCPDSSRSSVI